LSAHAAAGRPAPGAEERPSAQQLARITFVLLVLACFAAFFVTQRLKHTPTAVQRFELTPRFSPTPAGHVKEARISFKLARGDAVTVTIENSAGDTTATLVRDWPVPRYKQFSLRWNGHTGTARRFGFVHVPGHAGGVTSVKPSNDGSLAPAGEYRVRVNLRRQRRSVQSPRELTLVR
jgi:hypothetical protein